MKRPMYFFPLSLILTNTGNGVSVLVFKAVNFYFLCFFFVIYWITKERLLLDLFTRYHFELNMT